MVKKGGGIECGCGEGNGNKVGRVKGDKVGEMGERKMGELKGGEVEGGMGMVGMRVEVMWVKISAKKLVGRMR